MKNILIVFSQGGVFRSFSETMIAFQYGDLVWKRFKLFAWIAASTPSPRNDDGVRFLNSARDDGLMEAV